MSRIILPENDKEINDFIHKMRARIFVSHYKYGFMKDAYPHKIKAYEHINKRLDIYLETGNTELLIDVSNFSMIEFLYPSHVNKHFEATDDKYHMSERMIETYMKVDEELNKGLV
jgi:hypothetical protein